MNITATEHGVVRLFAVEGAQGFDHAALCAALGISNLDPVQVDIIAISDLDELGLEGYLTLGMGIPAIDVEAMRPQIAALTGTVALIRSAAFKNQAVILTPQAPLRWIASFGETALDTTAKPMKTASAQGTLSSRAPASKPSNTKVLMWILAVFALIVAITISMFIRITP